MSGNDQAPPEMAALHTVHRLADAQLVLASPERSWASVAATRFRLGKVDVSLPALGVPAFGVNYGRSMQLERTLNGRTVGTSAGAGQLSLLTPDAPSRWVFTQPGDVVLVFLNGEVFNRQTAQNAPGGRDAVELTPKFAVRDLVLERIAHRLLGEIRQPSSTSRLLTEELAEELAGHLILAHSNLQTRPQERAYRISPHRLRRAEEFIADNLGRELSLAEIAGAAGMSLFHFAKSFKRATGQAPHQYVTAQRLLRARALLHDERMSIAEVAGSVGLSHSYFTAVFSRWMGMTPRRFREVLGV